MRHVLYHSSYTPPETLTAETPKDRWFWGSMPLIFQGVILVCILSRFAWGLHSWVDSNLASQTCPPPPMLGGGNSHIFEFSPRNLGKMKPNWLEHIFQMGWFKQRKKTNNKKKSDEQQTNDQTIQMGMFFCCLFFSLGLISWIFSLDRRWDSLIHRSQWRNGRLEDVIRRVISKKKDYKELCPGRGRWMEGMEEEIFGSPNFF